MLHIQCFYNFYKSQDAHGVLEKHSVKMGSYVLVGLRTCCINCCKKFDLEAEINKHFKENIHAHRSRPEKYQILEV
jgi:hypothetical protein